MVGHDGPPPPLGKSGLEGMGDLQSARDARPPMNLGTVGVSTPSAEAVGAALAPTVVSVVGGMCQ